MRLTPSAATPSAVSSAACSPACSACPSSRGRTSGGLLYTGDPSLLVSQILGILVTLAFVIVAGLILGFIVKAVYRGKARVDENDEATGLDVALHGESAYPAYLGLD
ncbi:MAG: hypothetical protein V8R08_00085 [Coriobacteriales bacterium]